MEIRSVSVGVVAIKSVSTGLYLAMSKKGTLFGSVRIHPGNSVSGKVVCMEGLRGGGDGTRVGLRYLHQKSYGESKQASVSSR